MEGVSHATPLPHMEAPILDVKPLRCLAPISPGPFGYPPFPGSNPPPYASGAPFGIPPFAPLYTPVLPTGAPREAQKPSEQAPSEQTPSERTPSEQTPSEQTTQTPNGVTVAAAQGSDSNNPAQARNRSPVQNMAGSTNAQDGTSKTPKRRGRPPKPRPVVEMTSAGGDVNQSPLSSGFTVSPSGTEQSSRPSGFTLSHIETESRNEKSRKRKVFSKFSFNEGTVLLSPMEDGDRESVERTLMTYDGLRRRLMQVSDNPGMSSGRGKCPGLKAGAILMASGHRTNTKKRIGAVPGVEVGDIFYLRFELCLVGLHAQSMAGIDTLPVKFDGKEEPLAISIVSSGVYEDDDMEDMDVLIYTGQGGITKPGKQANDQKLERGNLALDKSSSRGNEIRVIKGMKDMDNPTGKVYMYDGLYRIQESWIEKGKAGFSVFKYKLLRVKGQPEGSAIWKRTRQWKNNPSCRGFVILPDLSSGVENISVCLVNEVDKEKGPAHFSYFNGVKYSIPLSSMKPPLSCKCYSVCISGDTNCRCVQQNGTTLPYSSNGHLVNRKSVIYECGPSCTCSLNCRNRVTQKGVKFQIEVFKTRDKGWGLRSWDPIRAGSFICEYAGQVIDDVKVEHEEEDNDYIFEATINTDQNSAEWNYKHDLLGEEKPVDLNETQPPLPIIINAKDVGNVSRFINHSCSPNVFWQPVLFDHNDERYPHIMFFALKHIPPMTELTFDYGQSASESGKNRRKKNCVCGSSKCRGFFP